MTQKRQAHRKLGVAAVVYALSETDSGGPFHEVSKQGCNVFFPNAQGAMPGDIYMGSTKDEIFLSENHLAVLFEKQLLVNGRQTGVLYDPEMGGSGLLFVEPDRRRKLDVRLKNEMGVGLNTDVIDTSLIREALSGQASSFHQARAALVALAAVGTREGALESIKKSFATAHDSRPGPKAEAQIQNLLASYAPALHDREQQIALRKALLIPKGQRL